MEITEIARDKILSFYKEQEIIDKPFIRLDIIVIPGSSLSYELFSIDPEEINLEKDVIIDTSDITFVVESTKRSNFDNVKIDYNNTLEKGVFYFSKIAS